MTRDQIIGGLGLLKALLRDRESQAILDGARELLKDQLVRTMDGTGLIRELDRIIDVGIVNAKQDTEALRKCREILKNCPRWISCDEQEPPEGETVLTLIIGHDVITQLPGETLTQAMERINRIRTVSAGFIGSDGWYGIDGYPEIVHPAYWMALPKAPDQEAEHE